MVGDDSGANRGVCGEERGEIGEVRKARMPRAGDDRKRICDLGDDDWGCQSKSGGRSLCRVTLKPLCIQESGRSRAEKASENKFL